MQLLYTDDHLAVCVKPVGVESEKELPELLAQQLGGIFYPIHRLDLNVGGVMVYARSKAAAATLSRAIQQGALVKEYLALVHGVPPERGDWHDLLWKDRQKNKVFIVQRMRKGVKEAHLTYERLTDNDPSLVHIVLDTGRSHQIRVQFAGRGFPLVGDHKYGARDDSTLPHLFSHRITFSHNGKMLTFSAMPSWAQTIKTES